MDIAAIEQLADQIWPLVASGAATQAGAAGAEEAREGIGRLLSRIRRSRRERGLEEMPADARELRAELARFAAREPDAGEILNTINNFNLGTITAKEVNFGISNRTSNRYA